LLSGLNTLKSDFSLPVDFATVGIAKSINITFSVGEGLCYLQGSLIFFILDKMNNLLCILTSKLKKCRYIWGKVRRRSKRHMKMPMKEVKRKRKYYGIFRILN
jgi:hypothetical protein